MTSIFSIIKNLGETVGDGVNICTTTVSGTNGGQVGISFFVSQSSSKTQRMYRVNVGRNSASDWKRLVPTSSVGKFPENNVWAVDILYIENICTLRLVRTSSATIPETSTLSIKLFAYATTGETVLVENSTTTYTGVITQTVYEGALVGLKDGNVGVNNDDPLHTLDVTGNINVKNTYKIRSNVILSETTLGPSVLYSSLQQVGNLQSLNVGGDINFTGNLLLNGNVYTGQVSDPRFMTFGTTTAFTYTGPGVLSDNPLPFSSLIQSRGVEFLGSTSNEYTFLESGTYAVQVEVESGYPWFPEGDMTTFFLINGNKMGVEHHDGGSSFKCTRFLNVDVNAHDTLSFFIDSIVGNVYDATVQMCRIRFSKVETGGIGSKFEGIYGGAVKFTGLTQATTSNFLYYSENTGNVTYDILRDLELTGNLTVNTTATFASVSTANVSATDVNVSGNVRVNGSIWASSVTYGTTTPFTYMGPGSAYSNGVSFYDQTNTYGTPFVTASGMNNSVFTFTTSGTYMLQAELETGYPWLPDGDIHTYFVKNGNVAIKFGSETYFPNKFSCTRPYFMTVSANDNVRFVIDSSSGNDYEATIYASRLLMVKF